MSLGNKFIPWVNVYEPPKYYINKGNINIKDNAKFKTIDSIGELFNIKVSFYQRIHSFFNIKNNIYVWYPNLKLMGDECKDIACDNEISDDGQYIFESRKQDNDRFVEEVINKNQIRYVFTKYKDETGEKMYKFKGVFSLDINKTKILNKRAKSIDLSDF